MKDAPLKECIGLLVVLGLLALPLVGLTGNRSTAESVEVPEEETSGHEKVFTLVKIRAAHEFQQVVLKSEGEIIGRLTGPAREGEIECQLDSEEAWLVLEAALDENSGQTAVALEFWPEGLPAKEKTFWGEGKVVEELQLRWLDE